MRLKLVVFDVDGTLVDSQGDILTSMARAFEQVGVPVPTRESVLGIVGLSLPQAMAKLVPDLPPDTQAALVEAYKHAYAALRAEGVPPVLYPGIADLLARLAQQDELLLGVATGKSRRGLTALLNALDLPHFVTTQVADDHPSKPHPSMLMTALAETGVEAADAVMIGDTTYDMDMARAAGMASIGVSWGYHPKTALSGASVIVDTATQLEEAITMALGGIT
ncbi:MAG: HAD-IA family hydrolase [Pelagimonas sp.]|jgi:phosphoglycolate phosphatase|nr:HAD-IA family hydrolase [Pelagimonas sp.]